MKHWKQGLVGLLVVLALAFAFTACDDSKNDDTPKPHTSTITAFGKTANVTGDVSIPAADFATAVENLKNALIDVEKDFNTLAPLEKAQLNNIMDRGITITVGNVAPASVGGTLTVGVDYLKLSDMNTIINSIFDLIDVNAFAMIITPVRGKVLSSA